jgi:hypothetical protein
MDEAAERTVPDVAELEDSPQLWVLNVVES